MLIVNDVHSGEMYYQCLIEPKGGHILEQDLWKEEALISLTDDSEVVFEAEDGDSRNYREYLEEVSKHGYKEVKPLGFKFYNSDKRGEEDFALDFQAKLLDRWRRDWTCWAVTRAGEAVIIYGTGASSKVRTVGRPCSKNAWSKVAPKFTIS